MTSISEAVAREWPDLRGHRWAEPDPAHLSALMREVFTDREKAQGIGAQARRDMAARFDYPQMAEVIVCELARLSSRAPVTAGGPPTRPEAPIPHISLDVLLP